MIIRQKSINRHDRCGYLPQLAVHVRHGRSHPRLSSQGMFPDPWLTPYLAPALLELNQGVFTDEPGWLARRRRVKSRGGRSQGFSLVNGLNHGPT